MSVDALPAAAILPIERIVLQHGRVKCAVRFSYGTQDFFTFTLILWHHIRPVTAW